MRFPFQTIERNNKPIDLIYLDLCNLQFVQIRGNNKYFITFFDDNTKYCYVFLLKSKDDALNKFVLYKTKVET